jgi:hypothetical protein
MNVAVITAAAMAQGLAESVQCAGSAPGIGGASLTRTASSNAPCIHATMNFSISR